MTKDLFKIDHIHQKVTLSAITLSRLHWYMYQFSLNCKLVMSFVVVFAGSLYFKVNNSTPTRSNHQAIRLIYLTIYFSSLSVAKRPREWENVLFQLNAFIVDKHSDDKKVFFRKRENVHHFSSCHQLGHEGFLSEKIKKSENDTVKGFSN